MLPEACVIGLFPAAALNGEPLCFHFIDDSQPTFAGGYQAKIAGMRTRRLTSGAWLCGFLLAVPYQAPANRSSGAATDALLAAVATWLDSYERSLPAIVGEEQYTQRASVEGRIGFEARTLRSDVLVVADDEYGWVVFRDVFEVDGRPVRNRDERLAELFLKPHADRHEQARRITAEGTRFNLDAGGYNIRRSVNNPHVALRFLRRQAQARSRFRITGSARVDRLSATVLELEEQATPRLIGSTDAAPTRGKFWIDTASGRVLRSELSLESGVAGQKTTTARTRIRVSYARDERMGEWLPSSMEEEYRVGAALVEGSARYSGFRRFTVQTSTDIKHQP
jgi:hypothetical protein